MKIARKRRKDLFLKKGRHFNREYAFGDYYLTLFSHRNQENCFANKQEKLNSCLEWLKFRSPEMYNYIMDSNKLEFVYEIYYSHWGPGSSYIKIKSKSYHALRYFRRKFGHILPYLINVTIEYGMLKNNCYALHDYQFHPELIQKYFPYKIDKAAAKDIGISNFWGNYRTISKMVAMINPLSVMNVGDMTLHFMTEKDMKEFIFYFKLNKE